ncbi:penicillin-binding protein [Staphylococcus succinus]|uniref:Penicillin-binding protein n=1 Tax=Staphylococcus succinus TaxID=61015 RepID=A0A9Q6MVB2_9STAP|nr:transglycosylase domain-containing protein [Staphylococcus succinus]MEB7461460.1 penicillin-binding protein [Staphylococcus succinus]MEB8209365.1 penicillin-binding protein [Staphylococcus succinus]PTI43351.1 penicillin-binding protein [Staphylococcus succinus]PTI76147.1 penicillin-binding protein [Staphylococcus succinus]PTJ19496.1 penicillin-binding protein [Staphylococcus succinus]
MTEKKRTSQSNKSGESEQKKNRNIKRTVIKIIGFLIIAFIVLALIGILLFAYYAWKAPAFTDSKLQDPIPAKIYDKNGELIKTIDNGQRREHVDLDEVPKTMKQAVLATEDNRFYDHGALDYKRLFGAVAKNVTGGFGSQGASTLTQQVVKRSFLTDQKSIARKAQEAYLSYRLEQEYSKDEIFQMYLNKIYYSDGVYGVKAAAKYYFNKDLKDLNLAESAYLAGLPQVPNTYNIYDHPKEAESRKNTVLYLMEYHNRITKKQKEEAQSTSIEDNLVQRTAKQREVTKDESNQEYDSYINFVKSELMNNKAFKNDDLGSVLNSGVKIYTNMEKDVQQTLQDRVNNGSYYKNDDQQVGSSIVDSETGGLVAISGGRNYKDIQDRNLATDAHPTGSSLKPFLAYGPAIENMQWATNHAIKDEESYQVDGVEFKNYDTKSHGTVKLYDALRESFNIPALKAWQSTKENAGNDAPKKFASKVGLDYESDIGPSEVLGGSASEFSPTQLASAFAAIANGGEYNNAHSIKKVVKQDGETIEYDHTSKKAMKDYTSYMLAEVLKGTFEAYGSAYGHGVSGINLAAKTGTGTYGEQTYQQYNLPDDAAKDVWINGFTPKYSMSVWMGFNQVKQGGVNSFVGHDEQEYPQYLLEDVMSDISPKDGKDFSKPDSVSGDDKDNLSVKSNPDDNTTDNKPEGQGSSSSSSSSDDDNDDNSSSSTSASSNSSNNSNSTTTNSTTNGATTQQQGNNNSSNTNALTKLFNLNAILDTKKSS